MAVATRTGAALCFIFLAASTLADPTSTAIYQVLHQESDCDSGSDCALHALQLSADKWSPSFINVTGSVESGSVGDGVPYSGSRPSEIESNMDGTLVEEARLQVYNPCITAGLSAAAQHPLDTITKCVMGKLNSAFGPSWSVVVGKDFSYWADWGHGDFLKWKVRDMSVDGSTMWIVAWRSK
mmetsp:Transcript_148165/g.369404  ORF Transcript_148165/g.369404 Transcript_148165/m.369404 type:complete len:182 (+) Transcript_148165:65-610(+)